MMSLEDQRTRMSPEDRRTRLSPDNQRNRISPEDQRSRMSPEDQRNRMSPEDQRSRMSPEDQMEIISTISMIFLLIFLTLSVCVLGQFPRVCTTPEALKSAQCCPEVNGQKCGGPGRGSCVDVRPLQSKDSSILQAYDDRLNWPQCYFNYTCLCEANFSGYDCTQCKFGFYGKNCEIKKILLRKEIRNLTDEERANLISYLTLAKSKKSEDYVILVTSDRHDHDTYRFIDASIYDIFSWIHHYSTKPIVINSSFTSHRNFAHQGPAFPVWHRLLLLFLEREIQRLVGDEDFALPYYNWSKDDNCTICTDEYMGSNDLEGNLNETCHFSTWKAICTGYNFEDAYCWSATVNETEALQRKPGAEPDTWIPTESDVNDVLQFHNYDTAPYNRSSQYSFRNALEGFLNLTDGKSEDHNMHNMFHSYIGGTLSYVPFAANDPIFFLHHNFIDKIFDTWMAAHLSGLEYPDNDQPGQNTTDCVTPFIPCYRNGDLLNPSIDFGYVFGSEFPELKTDELTTFNGDNFQPNTNNTSNNQKDLTGISEGQICDNVLVLFIYVQNSFNNDSERSAYKPFQHCKQLNPLKSLFFAFS
ncbi:PREDICTED: tyrosinase-like [Nanorana parkeri]|uniref:tyrosinase-like n=1 Tax=Nanorana parkeri TaxID=125878 RepID=UPI00085482E6|nr:PREDICTED: tyrosinase-like [Nanorana parkeri]